MGALSSSLQQRPQELHSSLGYTTVFIPAFQVNGTALQFSLGFVLFVFYPKVCGSVQSRELGKSGCQVPDL